MKFTTILTTVAYASVPGLVLSVAFSSVEQQADQLELVHDAGATLCTRDIEKRDVFTCFGSITASVSDCEAAIADIQNGPETFALYSDVCLNWREGTCAVRFCAVPYVQRPVNRTSEWVASFLTSPLLNCVRAGQAGIMADHPNVNSNAGTYRLHIEQAV
ncbi:Uu.00g092360.m01.CDS01 [Anthostomella pinea]|uniref:Uu.00g092360.m01.CDS01 n=1 Tax=Anthostomella pinea TaxID=933095 RepID=A0AAI8VPG0_9PEZI|nr:Uu.00g092360.m01.CDS01 [Anthostomella pinea]